MNEGRARWVLLAVEAQGGHLVRQAGLEGVGQEGELRKAGEMFSRVTEGLWGGSSSTKQHWKKICLAEDISLDFGPTPALWARLVTPPRRAWCSEQGGMIPIHLFPEPPSPRYLSVEQETLAGVSPGTRDKSSCSSPTPAGATSPRGPGPQGF